MRASLVFLMLVACNNSKREEAAVASAPDTPVFSAAVIDVQVPAVGAREEWHVGQAPTTVISTSEDDPNYDLYNVSGVYRLSDGRVVMAPGNGPIRLYGRDGIHQLTLGRKGSGPGEFQQIVKLGILNGDSIAAFDNLLGRISIYTSEGHFTRSLQVDGSIGGRMGAFLPGGSFVGEQRSRSSTLPAVDGVFREQLRLVSRELTDNSVVILGAVAGMIMTRTGSVPFSPSPQLAAGGNRLYVTPSDVYQIDAYERDGRQVHRLHADVKPAEVRRSEVNGFVNAQGLSAADQAAFERHAKTVEGKEAAHHRVIQRLMADDQDHVWVLPDSRATGAKEKTWYIYDADGQFVTTFPERIDGASLLSVGVDYVIAGRLGDAGYASIEVWPLTRNAKRR